MTMFRLLIIVLSGLAIAFAGLGIKPNTLRDQRVQTREAAANWQRWTAATAKLPAYRVPDGDAPSGSSSLSDRVGELESRVQQLESE